MIFSHFILFYVMISIAKILFIEGCPAPSISHLIFDVLDIGTLVYQSWSRGYWRGFVTRNDLWLSNEKHIIYKQEVDIKTCAVVCYMSSFLRWNLRWTTVSLLIVQFRGVIAKYPFSICLILPISDQMWSLEQYPFNKCLWLFYRATTNADSFISLLQ